MIFLKFYSQKQKESLDIICVLYVNAKRNIQKHVFMNA